MDNEKLKIATEAGKILSDILKIIYSELKVSISAEEIDNKIHKLIKEKKAEPSFLHYQGFPNSSCISFNEEIVHGIPNDRKIKDGDIIKVDVGLYFKGIHVDAAFSKGIGNISENDKKMIRICKNALNIATDAISINHTTGDMGDRLQEYIEKNGFSVVRDYCGHGIGEKLHMAPSLPNFGKSGTGQKFENSCMYAIEPMITNGNYETVLDKNHWTVKTKDGSRSAHFETTFALFNNKLVNLVPFILSNKT